MIGKTIGNYRIAELLGRGSMGAVYRGLELSTGRDVALKLLTPDMLHGAALAQFEADIATLTAIAQPQIAAVFEVHHAGHDVLLVMELVRGLTLDQVLPRVGPLTPEQAVWLTTQLLDALVPAHAAGIVHRDLKTAHVMVTGTGAVKVLDFGTSRISGAALMTALGPTFGASAYMAPERILGNEIDARADLYALGVLLYRLLTGVVPFAAATPTELVQQQLSAVPATVRSLRPELLDWCEPLLVKALAKAPEERFQSAGEFLAALPPVDAAAAAEAVAFFAAAVEAGQAALAAVAAESTAANPALAPTLLAPIPETAPTALDPALAPTLLAAIPVGDAVVDAATAPTLMAPVSATPDSAAALAPTLVAAVPPAAGLSEATAPGAPSTARTPLIAADPLAATLAAPVPEAVTLPPDLTRPLAGVPLNPAVALAPTLAMPQWPAGVSPATAPTLAAPAGWAPTVAVPAAGPAPGGPAAGLATTTLVMERKQFAAAGVLLAALALAVVVLAVIVLRRPASIVVRPEPATAAATAPPVAAPSTVPAPTPIADPPVVTTPAPATGTRPATPAVPPAAAAGAPDSGSGGSPAADLAAAPAPPAAASSAPAASAASTGSRPSNALPFIFEARAVVSDGDKHRERDANVLVADGTLRVMQKDDKPLYVIPLRSVTSLTYSNSRQPLWASPSGTAEAMKVDGGTFGFLKGGRNWFGIHTPESLLVLRVDDGMVARVIAGLQERVGLPVARLIEPKE